MVDRVDDIAQSVKRFVLREFLPGADPDELTATTPLMTGGILDSISILQLVEFLEQQYGVEFEAHELAPENLDTLSSISGLVESKLSLAQ